jgi:(1->4)-alpha-D-glucan 1-alpha-D-glucosylmutase
MFVTMRLLAQRRTQPLLFAAGDYQPLDISAGRNAERLCAFARRHEGALLAVVVPRLTWGLYGSGTGTAEFGATEVALPPASRGWRNVFTGAALDASPERVRAAELFRDFPVAVLAGEASE